MILASSVIAGFRAILGSVGVQLAMFLALVFIVKTPTSTFEGEDPENNAASDIAEL